MPNFKAAVAVPVEGGGPLVIHSSCVLIERSALARRFGVQSSSLPCSWRYKTAAQGRNFSETSQVTNQTRIGESRGTWNFVVATWGTDPDHHYPFADIPSLSAQAGHSRIVTMPDLNEYRQYARECVRWAAEAKDQEDRETFLEMARAWTRVALAEHDVIIQSLLDGIQPVKQRLHS
jgi:hypothetical protein